MAMIFTPKTLANMSWKMLLNCYETACFQAGRIPTPENRQSVMELRNELIARVKAVHAMTKV